MNISILLICFNVLQYSFQKSLRVLSGRDARSSEFPYVARMEMHYTHPNTKKVDAYHVCTCTVITKAWSLTAAHCNVGLNGTLKRIGSNAKGVVRYGLVEKNTKMPCMKDKGIRDIVHLLSHPDYFGFSNKKFSIRNDVGLVKTKNIHMIKYGKISAVDYTTLYGYELMAVGFGVMNSSCGMNTTLYLKKPLQVVKVLAKKCESDVKFEAYPVLCLAQRCGTATAVCPGDSGGPALHRGRVVAVNSYTSMEDCHTSHFRKRRNDVGFLTPISLYIDWIAAHVNAVDNK